MMIHNNQPLAHRHITILSLGLACVLLSLGCGDDRDDVYTNDLGGETRDAGQDLGGTDVGLSEAQNDEVSRSENCSSTRRPLIFIHGFLAAGDTWSRHVQRLVATGSCLNRIKAYDWNTLDMNGDHIQGLEMLLDELLLDAESDQVDLVGHSAGGGLAYQFLSDAQRARKVHHYVHVGSFPNDAPPTPEGALPIPTLNLWSQGDLTVEGGDIDGATNVTLEQEDHYAVATSLNSFQELVTFLYQDQALSQDPRPSPQEDGEVTVSGRALTLGENRPERDMPLTVWSLNTRGQRQAQVIETTTDSAGHFRLEGLKAQGSYEFVIQDANEDQSDRRAQVRYFTPPLKRDDPLMYLRTFPGPGTLASILVSQLPQAEDQISIVFFNAHRAFLTGRDSLTLNGRELLTPEVANAENTTIAIFAFDIDGDGQQGGTLPLFDRFPFLAALDVPFEPNPQSSLEVKYNGLTLHLPADPASEGTMIVVFP